MNNTGLRWRDWVAALSLANLVYLRVWTELLASNSSLYWLKTPPKPVYLIAVMANVVLLSLVLLAGIAFLRRGGRLARRIMPLFGLAILISLINSLRTLVGRPGNSLFLRFVEQRLPAIGVVVTIVIVVTLVFGGLRALKPVYHLLILLSPLVVFCFAQATYRLATYDPAFMADGPGAGLMPAKPAGAPRVVWVIFDEWDQDLLFRERPARIPLPAIDRLRKISFAADAAVTSNTMTDWSMPALTTGKAVDDVREAGPVQLLIRYQGDAGWVPWSRQDNVFRDARRMGFNTAVVAYAIPYCRVLNGDLSECWWSSGSNQYNSAGETMTQVLLGQPRSLYENIYRSPFGQSSATKRHKWVYDSAMSKALEVAGERAYGLTLLHLPVPHPPYFYNARTGRADLNDEPLIGILRQNQQGYIDALALTDVAVARLRAAMEQAGVWDSTTIIFSADHPYRHRAAMDGKAMSRYVPFLVKMAGSQQEMDYHSPFSTLLTRKLIGAILSGELTRADQLAAWLDAHRNDFPLAPAGGNAQPND